MPEFETTNYQLRAQRVVLTADAPKVANNFSVMRVGDDFLFEVGFFDLYEMGMAFQQEEERRIKEPGSKNEIGLNYFITDKFSLNLAGAKRLVEIAGQVAKMIELDGSRTK